MGGPDRSATLAQEAGVDARSILQIMQTWPVRDQLDFLFRAWDRILDSGWQPELTEEWRAELDRRLAAHQVDPDNVLTWEQVLAHVKGDRDER
jgi:putative addiction module component (TIGR02574 family)